VKAFDYICEGQMNLFDFINHQVTCKIDKSFQCNHANAKQVALSCGENCIFDCCLTCKEMCGCRCNPSAHLNKPKFLKKTCAATLKECDCHCGTDSVTDKCCGSCIEKCEHRCEYSMARYEVFDKQKKEWVQNPNYYNYVWDLISHGTGFVGGMDRVRNYFKQSHKTEERISFLKKEYGEGGFGMPHDGGKNLVHSSWSGAKGIKINYLDAEGIDYEELIDWKRIDKEILFLVDKGWY